MSPWCVNGPKMMGRWVLGEKILKLSMKVWSNPPELSEGLQIGSRELVQDLHTGDVAHPRDAVGVVAAQKVRHVDQLAAVQTWKHK